MAGGNLERRLTIVAGDISLEGGSGNSYDFPNVSDTLVGIDATQVLTNKTITGSFSGSHYGSFVGSASWADSSSAAISASWAPNVGGATDHGGLTGLLDDDHTQYLKVLGIAVVSSSGQVVHDSTAGIDSNEHIDHTAVSVIAGSGMTGGGTIAANKTLNVIGGDGITANADNIVVDATVLRTTAGAVVSASIQITHDSTTGVDPNEHIDHTAVSVIAGAGLTGGGTIASNRTLNVVGGDGITANADDIEVDSTVLRTTGAAGVISSSAQFDNTDRAEFLDITSSVQYASQIQNDGNLFLIMDKNNNSTNAYLDICNHTSTSELFRFGEDSRLIVPQANFYISASNDIVLDVDPGSEMWISGSATNTARLAGVVWSTSTPSGQYPSGTIWCKY